MEENRRLVVLVHRGPFVSLLKNTDADVQQVASEAWIISFGTRVQRENDLARALDLSLDLRQHNTKTLITELTLLVSEGVAQVEAETLLGLLDQQAKLSEVRVLSSLLSAVDDSRYCAQYDHPYALLLAWQDPSTEPRLNPEPLIGRERELALFDELIEQIRVDHGQMLGITGKPGSGKTVLFQELRRRIHNSQTLCFSGHYSIDTQDPFEGLRPMMLGLLKRCAANMVAFEREVMEVFLGLREASASLTQIQQKDFQQNLLAVVRKLLHQEAQRPLAILLEDVHWAPAQSKDILAYLFSEFHKLKILVLTTQRPEFVPPWHDDLNYNPVNIAPFSTAEIELLTRRVVSADHYDSRIFVELEKLSLGNALFSKQLLQHALHLGFVDIHVDKNGTSTARLAKPITSIPASLHSLLAAKLDELSPIQRDILSWSMLLGPVANSDELEGLVQEQFGQAGPATIKELFSLEYFSERSFYPTRTHSFSHDLVFEIVKDRLNPDEGQKKHEELAWYLKRHHKDFPNEVIERVAWHFHKSHNTYQAVVHATLAGEHLLQFFKYREAYALLAPAYQWLARVIHLNIDLDRFFRAYAEVLLVLGSIEQIRQLFAEWSSLRKLGQAKADMAYFTLKVRHHLMTDEYPEALASLAQAEELLGSREETRQQVLALAPEKVNTLFLSHEIKQATHEGFRYLRQLQSEGEGQALTRMRLWARLALASIRLGEPSLGVGFVVAGDALAGPDLSPLHRMEFLRFSLLTLQELPHLNDFCARIHSQIIDLATRNGLRQQISFHYFNRGLFYWRQGKYRQAMADYENAITEALEFQDQNLALEALLRHIDLLLDLGAIERAKSQWHRFCAVKTKALPPYLAPYEAGLAPLMAHSQWQYDKAARGYRELAQLYGEPLPYQATREELRALLAESEVLACNVPSLAQRFTELFDAARPFWQKIRPWVYVTAYHLAILGTNLPKQLNLEEDVFESENDPYRLQWLYVGKIKWLDFLGRKAEAKELREAYRHYRTDLAKNVPQEFLAEFHTHPLFKVP